MKLPNDNCLGEMLEATRAELRRATAKVARLEAQKADLVDMVLRYLHRAETAENRLKHIPMYDRARAKLCARAASAPAQRPP